MPVAAAEPAGEAEPGRPCSGLGVLLVVPLATLAVFARRRVSRSKARISSPNWPLDNRLSIERVGEINMEDVLRDMVGRRVSVRMVDEAETEGTLEGVSGMWLRLRDRKNALICVYLPNVCFLEERL